MTFAPLLSANLDSCQPRLTASLRPGFVRLRCEMNGAPAVRVHTRIRGCDWRLLIDRCESPNIDDYTPAETPGREETREYRASALNGDEEAGHPSEIVSVAVPR